MTVGEAGDQAVGRVLADVARGEDDPLRVVVAEAEDRVGEVVGEARVDAQRREIEIARLDDGPVAAVDFGFGVAGVDDFRRNLLAAIHDLHRRDLPRALAVVFVLERHHGVLHGDEVSVTQVAGGAIVGLPEVVGRIELHEARAAIAQQVNREQPHLVLQLRLDLRDDARPRGRCGQPVARSRETPAGPGRHRDVRLGRARELRAKRVELCVVQRLRRSVGAAYVQGAERKEGDGGGEEGCGENDAPDNHF